MREQLLPDGYAGKLAQLDNQTYRDKLYELKEMVAIMSPEELAGATASFIGYRDLGALDVCCHVAWEQSRAALDIGNQETSRDYAAISNWGRFEQLLIEGAEALPTYPSCRDRFFELAYGN